MAEQGNQQTQRLPIRELKPVEFLMILRIGEHRRRRVPVSLPEVESFMMPFPTDESIDDIGAMGLLRPAENDRGLPIRGTCEVTPIGWAQLAIQKRRVLREAQNEADRLDVLAKSTASPADPTRRKDPSGAREFERQARAMRVIREEIERLCVEVLDKAPLPTSVRSRMNEDDQTASMAAQNEERRQKSDADLEREIEDAADPANAGRVAVDGPTGSQEGLADMLTDGAGPEDKLGDGADTAPAARPRRRG